MDSSSTSYQLLKRPLTSDEIESILDFITINKDIPVKTSLSIVTSHKSRLRKQLEKQLVYPQIIPALKKKIEKNFKESLIQPGESVGIICAQSIGEKNTQSTLNTFHFCGQSEKTVLAGVPRLQELLNTTRVPKASSCKIFFEKGSESVETLRDVVADNIVEMSFQKLSTNMKVITKFVREPWCDAFDVLYNDEPWFKKYSDYESCVEVTLNKNLLFRYRIKAQKLATVINDAYDDLACIFSPEQEGKLYVFSDTKNILPPPKNARSFITAENCVEVYLDECVRKTIEGTRAVGISGIENIYFTHTDGGKKWYIETDGSNFADIISLSIVDSTTTISNNIWQVYEVLGIEATREFLIQEFMSIMEGINVCHTKLLVERMTFSGTISSISRYTMRKDESGPLCRASFEESVDNFIKAAIVGEVENTNGVSSSIITGKRARVGTAMMDLKIDMENLPPHPSHRSESAPSF
jgi:DNA-directed RNA polymerase beta' subunit